MSNNRSKVTDNQIIKKGYQPIYNPKNKPPSIPGQDGYQPKSPPVKSSGDALEPTPPKSE